MQTVMSFPGLRHKKSPSIEEISSLFLQDFPVAWTEDADVTFYFDNEHYTRLTAVPNAELGLWLRHQKTQSNNQTENFFSLRDPNQLDTYVDAVEDAVTLKGFFVTPEETWLAVRDFIQQDGKRSDQINWISEADLPEGKHWLISVDCL